MPGFSHCQCCGSDLAEIGQRSGYCQFCATLPRRRSHVAAILQAEGWGDCGFDLAELAETIAIASMEHGELTVRQQWVFSQYVIAAAARIRMGEIEVLA